MGAEDAPQKSQEKMTQVRVLRGRPRHHTDVSQEVTNIYLDLNSIKITMLNSNSSKQVQTFFSLPSLPATLEDPGVIFGVGVTNKE